MTLSKRSFEMILDLIENKVSCMEGWDQTTARERAKLEACRREFINVCEPGELPDQPVMRGLQQGTPQRA
jgi:hypothetical protein